MRGRRPKLTTFDRNLAPIAKRLISNAESRTHSGAVRVTTPGEPVEVEIAIAGADLVAIRSVLGPLEPGVAGLAVLQRAAEQHHGLAVRIDRQRRIASLDRRCRHGPPVV